MNILRNCTKLSSNIKIYVPSTINLNEKSNNEHWINLSMKLLSKEFGGATSTKVKGSYLSTSGEIIEEDITMIISFATPEQLKKSMKIIYDFCMSMKNCLAQESIALEKNGKLYLL